MAQVTASTLRQNIYSILDEVLDTGIPVEIQRKGRTLRIVAEAGPSKLARLKKRDWVVGDLDSLVHMDWSGLWSGAGSEAPVKPKRRKK